MLVTKLFEFNLIYENLLTALCGVALACEDFSPDDFESYHCFFKYEDGIISQIMAHGPVLLRGGRGTGKSAILIEAARRLDNCDTACGICLSLRHLPLLRSIGDEYEKELLKLLVDKVSETALKKYDYTFICDNSVSEVQKALNDFSKAIAKRIVLIFDDAAHIGRETGLEEFFDIFRTLSNSRISCKAAIYPGVTKFGTRFDVFNDAKTIDLLRFSKQSSFSDFFYEVMKLRYGKFIEKQDLFSSISSKDVANFLGLAVLGNVRSFIKGCSMLFEDETKITLPKLGNVLLSLASDFYWPMLEEISYKIGIYEPFMELSMSIAEHIYEECGEKKLPRSLFIGI